MRKLFLPHRMRLVATSSCCGRDAEISTWCEFSARDEVEFSYIRPTGTHAYAWIASDLNPNGVVGNASIATAERGRVMAEHQVGKMLELLQEVARHPGFS